MGGNDWTTNEALLRVAFQMGVTYWDAASDYENGKCELGIGQYFAKYPADRKKVFLVTKPTRAFIPKEMEVLLTQSLERMKTDYIDLLSLQGVQDPDMLTPEVKAWSEQKKKEGKIRFFGVNSHANVPQMLMAASKLGWIDSVNTSYSYQMMNDEMKKGMDAIAKAGIGFVAMKTQGQRFGGGPPPNMPAGQGGGPPGSGGQSQGQGGPQGQGGQPQGQPPGMQAQAASQEPEDLSAIQHFIDKGYTLEQAKLKFVWEDERVASCLSKMTSMTILKDNVSAASDGNNLSSLDIKVLNRLAENTCSLYCQGCMRCELAMSSESRIYDVLRYMMYYNSYGERDQARELFRQMPETIRSAMPSRDYTKAEAVCPNRIRIGSAMREAARLLG
jgi:predicted aldo/keto reductase-like oxidoreductase